MSGHLRRRSTVDRLRPGRRVDLWVVLAVVAVSLIAAVVWLPAATAATESNLTVTNVTPADDGVVASDPLPVTIELNNTGSIAATNQTVSLSVDTDYDPTNPNFTVVNETTVSLNASETTTQTLHYDTDVGTGGDIEVRATTVDDPAGSTATATIDSTFDLTAVDTVESFSASHEFIGVVRDPDTLELTATLTANGTPITGNVTVRIVRSGTVLYDAGETTVIDGEFATTVDPREFPIDTSTGGATVELGGEAAGTIGLYHEVRSLPEGTHPMSVPQPAQVSVDGSFRATQWDPSTGSYSSAGFSAGDFSGAAAVNQGFYLLAEEPVRVGFAFEPEDGGTASLTEQSLTPGWNLISSNYDISSNDHVELSNELFLNESKISAFHSPAGDPLSGSDLIYPFDAYWVYADSTVDRGIILAKYNATARGR